SLDSIISRLSFSLCFLLLLLVRLPPCFTLFTYTTLFRSLRKPCHWHKEHCRLQSQFEKYQNAYLYQCHLLDLYQYVQMFRAEKRSEEHTSELQSRENLVCRLLLVKKNKNG